MSKYAKTKHSPEGDDEEASWMSLGQMINVIDSIANDKMTG